jgi:hypothetical protein
MKYFATLPYLITYDPQGNMVAAKNLLVRTSIIPQLLNNPALYYEYDIQEGDTPEVIATKYYGDPYRYWLVLFANQIFDAQWQWPLTYQRFNDYIVDKYGSTSAAQANTYQYQKTISTTDSITQNTTTDIYVVDENTYVNTIENTEIVNLQPTQWNQNAYITIVTTKQELSVYDWELQQNENLRSIKIINSNYVSQFEAQFESLVNVNE